MTVQQLMETLRNAPPDAVVLVPADDHSYRECAAALTTALKGRGRSWTEDHGEELTPEKEYGKRVAAVVIQ